MERPSHISVHIEKTAGTSLQELYVRGYGVDRVLIYSVNTNSLISASDSIQSARINPLLDKLKQIGLVTGVYSLLHRLALNSATEERMKISNRVVPKPGSWEVIHGHFIADKFDDTLVHDPYRSIVFREPLQRAISHYLYWRNAKGILNHRLMVSFDQKMTFIDFSENKNVQNFQSSALGNLKIGDFDLVGISEDMPTFVSKLISDRGLETNLKGYPIRQLNVNPRSFSLESLGIDDGFIKKFRSQNELDYMNYNRALEINSHNAL